MDQYHGLSDATMEVMLDSLENVLDEEANPDYEVDYSVSWRVHSSLPPL